MRASFLLFFSRQFSRIFFQPVPVSPAYVLTMPFGSRRPFSPVKRRLFCGFIVPLVSFTPLGLRMWRSRSCRQHLVEFSRPLGGFSLKIAIFAAFSANLRLRRGICLCHRGTDNVRRESFNGQNETVNASREIDSVRRDIASGRRETFNGRRATAIGQNGTVNARRVTDSARRETFHGRRETDNGHRDSQHDAEVVDERGDEGVGAVTVAAGKFSAPACCRPRSCPKWC